MPQVPSAHVALASTRHQVVHAPHQPYTVIRRLGGSTGADLVQMQDGRMLVRKMATSPQHLAEELAASDMYRAAGVRVPAQEAHYAADGTPIASFAELIEGPPQSAIELDVARRSLGRHFAVDALLANWDVANNGDNVRFLNGSIPVRVDNGGALRFRARGGPKGDSFGQEVVELATMRSPHTAAGRVFGQLTDSEVAVQILDVVVPRRAALLEAAPAGARDVIDRRIDFMRRWASDVRSGAGISGTGAVPMAAAVSGLPRRAARLYSLATEGLEPRIVVTRRIGEVEESLREGSILPSLMTMPEPDARGAGYLRNRAATEQLLGIDPATTYGLVRWLPTEAASGVAPVPGGRPYGNAHLLFPESANARATFIAGDSVNRYIAGTLDDVHLFAGDELPRAVFETSFGAKALAKSRFGGMKRAAQELRETLELWPPMQGFVEAHLPGGARAAEAAALTMQGNRFHALDDAARARAAEAARGPSLLTHTLPVA